MDDIKQVIDKVDDISNNVGTMKADMAASFAKVKAELEAGYKNQIDEFKAELEQKGNDIKDLQAIIEHYKSNPNNDDSKFYDYVGHYIMAYMSGNPSERSLEWLKVNNALKEGANSTGGALVPDQYMPELIDLLAEYGVFRNEARVVPMSGDTQVWPKIDSGLTVYAPGEAGSITASDPVFSNVRLVATKLATLTAISSELAEDAAIAIGQIVGQEIVRALAKAEDQAGFLGDGTSTYWGYVGLTGAMGRVTKTTTDGSNTGGGVSATGHQWTDITISDIRLLISLMPQKFAANAKFYCSKVFYWTVLVPLVQAAGGLTQANLEMGPNMMLEGYPVVIVDVMPTTTAVSQYCLFFADLKSAAYFGDRRDLRIEQSKDAYFTTDQIGIRGTERFAINVFGEGDDTNPGPLCALYTAAD